MAESSEPKRTLGERQFDAEAAYADSIFRDALGDRGGSIMALELALVCASHSQHGFGLISTGESRRRAPVVPIAIILAEEHNRDLPDHR